MEINVAIRTSIFWKIKGKGNWQVSDYKKRTKFLFRTKMEAKRYAKDNNIPLEDIEKR